MPVDVALICSCTESPRAERSALRSWVAPALETTGRRIALSPAPRARDRRWNCTVTRLCPLRGRARGVTEPVTVSEHAVSQPTRSATLRADSTREARSTRTDSCGPTVVGRVGSFGGGGLPTGPSWAQLPAGGAASANCWTRL